MSVTIVNVFGGQVDPTQLQGEGCCGLKVRYNQLTRQWEEVPDQPTPEQPTDCSAVEAELAQVKQEKAEKEAELAQAEADKATKEAELQAKTQELEQARQEIATKDERIAELERNQANSDNQPTDQPNTDQPNTDQPNTDQPNTDQPNTDQPTAPVTPFTLDFGTDIGYPEHGLKVGRTENYNLTLTTHNGNPEKFYTFEAGFSPDNGEYIRHHLADTLSDPTFGGVVRNLRMENGVVKGEIKGGDRQITIPLGLTPVKAGNDVSLDTFMLASKRYTNENGGYSDHEVGIEDEHVIAPADPVYPPLSYDLTYRSGMPLDDTLHAGQTYTLLYDFTVTGGDPSKQYRIVGHQMDDTAWVRATLNEGESTGITALAEDLGQNYFAFNVTGGEQHLTLAMDVVPRGSTPPRNYNMGGITLSLDNVYLSGPEQQTGGSYRPATGYYIE